MIALDEALDRLLHLRAYRQALLEKRWAALDLSEHDLAALESIDVEQLRRTAERVVRDLAGRKHRGSGGLRELFPRTLEAWLTKHPEDADLEELMLRFLESDAHTGYRELPFTGVGTSLEEAFFLFCEGAGIGDATTRELELLSALVKALLLSPNPSFSVPAAVRAIPHGFLAVARRGAPHLFAAARGRFISGPITPFVADLLTSVEDAAEVARRHGVSPEVLAASAKELRALGVLA